MGGIFSCCCNSRIETGDPNQVLSFDSPEISHWATQRPVPALLISRVILAGLIASTPGDVIYKCKGIQTDDGRTNQTASFYDVCQEILRSKVCSNAASNGIYDIARSIALLPEIINKEDEFAGINFETAALAEKVPLL
jgi:hypothetical protein